MQDVVNELLASEIAVGKLGRRAIASDEARQLAHNRHAVARDSSEAGEPGKRRILIGRTDGGRTLTLVIEWTLDPTTWLIITPGTPPRSSVSFLRDSDEQRPVDSRRSAAWRL